MLLSHTCVDRERWIRAVRPIAAIRLDNHYRLVSRERCVHSRCCCSCGSPVDERDIVVGHPHPRRERDCVCRLAPTVQISRQLRFPRPDVATIVTVAAWPRVQLVPPPERRAEDPQRVGVVIGQSTAKVVVDCFRDVGDDQTRRELPDPEVRARLRIPAARNWEKFRAWVRCDALHDVDFACLRAERCVFTTTVA